MRMKKIDILERKWTESLHEKRFYRNTLRRQMPIFSACRRQSCRKDRSTLSCPAIISIGIMRKRKDIPARPCLPKRSRFLFAMVSESKNMIWKAV